MSEKKKEELDRLLHEDHDYDGIQEYDNPMPRWWVYLFYICIVFAFWYMGYYTAKALSIEKASKKNDVMAWSGSRLAMEQHEAEKILGSEEKEEFSGPALLAYLEKPETIQAGKKLFQVNCISCHLDKGQGSIGPNLTDTYWIHGARPEDIRKIITEGNAVKGMPTWGPVLGKKAVLKLSAFVLSIKGTNVAGKAPQGTQVGTTLAAVKDIAAVDSTSAEAVAKGVGSTSLITALKDPANIEAGEKLFKLNCVACHMSQGQGMVGPNLTDGFWIHPPTPEGIHDFIAMGNLAKGMPSWKPVLGENGVTQVAAFVLSIAGKNIKGKAPEGDKAEVKW